MAEFHSIEGRTGRGQVKQEIVDLLTEWLGKARNGEFAALGMVGIHPDGTALIVAPKNDNAPALIGALSLLQFEIMSRVP
jgi:hypothetical protein